MAEEKETVQIPEPPEIRMAGWPGYPAEIVKKFKEVYARTLKQAEAGQSNESFAHQAAQQEANKAIRSPHPESYEEAMALPDWEIARFDNGASTRRVEEEKDGNGNLTGRKVLRGLTIHGHAFRRPPVKGRRGLGPLGFIVPEAAEGPQSTTTDLSGAAGNGGSGKGKGKGNGKGNGKGKGSEKTEE